MSRKLLQDLPQQQTWELLGFLQGCSVPDPELKYPLNYHHPFIH